VSHSFFLFIAATHIVSTPGINDPNNSNSGLQNDASGGDSNTGGLSKASLIGICVSVGIVIYAAATIAVIRVYRKRRADREEKAIVEHQVFAQSISEPIMQDNSLGWSNTGNGYNHQRQPYGNNASNHQW
jgi:hypothetical protein